MNYIFAGTVNQAKSFALNKKNTKILTRLDSFIGIRAKPEDRVHLVGTWRDHKDVNHLFKRLDYCGFDGSQVYTETQGWCPGCSSGIAHMKLPTEGDYYRWQLNPFWLTLGFYVGRFRFSCRDCLVTSPKSWISL